MLTQTFKTIEKFVGYAPLNTTSVVEFTFDYSKGTKAASPIIALKAQGVGVIIIEPEKITIYKKDPSAVCALAKGFLAFLKEGQDLASVWKLQSEFGRLQDLIEARDGDEYALMSELKETKRLLDRAKAIVEMVGMIKEWYC